MIHATLRKKQRMIVVCLLLLIIATSVISIGLGAFPLSYDRIIPTILGSGSFKEEFVLFSIRLPRMIITLLAGMALALSGSILQGITRNDLADPGIIGINAGAGVAISLFFLYFPIEAGSFIYWLPLVAFLGAILTATFIYIFSYQKHVGLAPIRFVLTGVGLSLALSGVMIMLISTTEREKVAFISKWLAGSIWGTDWPFIWALLPWLVLLIPYTLFKANRLNLLGLSEPVAIGVGVSIERERRSLLIVAVALAAATVSVTGGISFVGLMAPHIAKALVGTRTQQYLPVAILIGGWLLLVADLVGRNIASPDGIPAGIMISIIGAPYFIYLLLRK
ncbi:iron ABC transporter permease [Virgibacillus sp. LDC-1]|uniref:FecCD family ABC transporter permease n=1 Tax=Virgibacillus sp. LDC-1 TaxID=3039856 RepID=UPI0024DEF9AD|nr:iron ABC transporter permease [Virgibacillus sp. LDC-1]